MNKEWLLDLLSDIRDYMDERSDVDDDGYFEDGTFSQSPNEEMMFVIRIDDIIKEIVKS
jgi:hypothetical protein